MSSKLGINEIFGPTFQGEGKSFGMPCAFLRLAGCGLACVWCDTKYTWDWNNYDPKKEIHPTELDDAYNQIVKIGTKNLVISGGEPLLQQKHLLPLALRLRNNGWWIEIETAGVIIPIDYEIADQFNVSPKLINSGNSLKKRYKPEALRSFAESKKSIFKFVVSNIDDFEEIDTLVNGFRMKPVYIMPEGVSAENIATGLKNIATETVARQYNLTTRLHVELYGNRRGI